MATRRVVITGVGLISCLGNDPDTFFDNLVEGKPVLRPYPDLGRHPVGRAQFAPEQHFTRTDLLGLDRVSQFAIVASREAAANADLTAVDKERLGVFFGTGTSGAATLEASYGNFFGVRPERYLCIPMAMNHAPASQVAISLGAMGECQTYSTACSSSAVAIGEGYRRIKDGYVDVAVAGGAECMLVPSVMNEWEKLRVLAPAQGDPSSGCRPFDASRRGFHLAESAATVILESVEHATARGAPILGEIAGYGLSNDASHITKPSPAGQRLAIKRAMADAGISPGDLAYVNLHGTATGAGDLAEAQSVEEVFGEIARRVPMSATKSSHGHAIGATGALEFIATLWALRRGIAPPTAFTEQVAPGISLNLICRQAELLRNPGYGASNSFAFGGANAVLVLRKTDH